MSERCRGKWKWRCGEHPCPGEHWTLTSPPCVTTPNALWMPTFMDSYWGFTKQAYWLNHCPLVAVLNLSALSSPQSCRKFTPVATPSMILVTTSMTERFSGPFLWLVSTPMNDRKFQLFQEVWDMNQVRIKYANKIVVNTRQGREQTWIINNSQKGTWERAWKLS